MQNDEDTSLLHYMDGLYRYAMVLTRNAANAADLVQEAYLRAFLARERLREDSNVKSWLFTILRNIWLNQLRRSKTALETVDLDASKSPSNGSSEGPKDPYTLYAVKIERERVREAIHQLPADSREIIILREYEELSYQEISTILRCPPGTVMSRLARARSKLRALLTGR
jgi:RNA polymerase sigma-70 factor (ECF subfamily)